uniref:Carboxylesterase type B domain-containing protein n=1 Tax=Vombatus ursinus TaxID=29139 RepID=A0A4X2LRS4_VOMUR
YIEELSWLSEGRRELSGETFCAIMESSVAIFLYLKTLNFERNHDLQVLAYLCSCDKDSVALVWCLLGKTEDEILIVDGEFLPQSHLDLLSDPNFKAVASIITVNNHKYGYGHSSKLLFKMVGSFHNSTNNALVFQFSHIFSNIYHFPFLELVADEYFGVTEYTLELRDQLLDIMGNVFFVISGPKTSQYHIASGSPTYMYEFQHRSSFWGNMKPENVKADHGDDIFPVLGAPFLKGDGPMLSRKGASEEEKQLSRTMMKYWANFARNGDPNGEDLLKWPAYDQNKQHLEFDINITIGKELKDKKLEFWSKTQSQKMISSAVLHSSFHSLASNSLLLTLLTFMIS